ncbi:MAG: hypothetical protein SGI73_03375 [Chloroflexota bacterium]|nr:hypothetical protein [Chloroflexota bacterium]
MRLLALVSLCCLCFNAVIARAQPAPIDVTVIVEREQLVIVVPAPAALDSVTFGVVIRGERRDINLSDFSELPARGEFFVAPACFVLRARDTRPPLPLDCPDSQPRYLAEVGARDVFWYDEAGNLDRQVEVVVSGVSAGFVQNGGALQAPVPEWAGSADPRAIMVLIAELAVDGDADADMQRVWARRLQAAAAAVDIGGSPVRIYPIWGIIRDAAQAARLANAQSNTLIIWGERSPNDKWLLVNYTLFVRAGSADVQPGVTDVYDAPDIVGAFRFDGADSAYALNFALAQLAYFSDNRAAALPFLARALDHAEQHADRAAALNAGALYFYSAFIHYEEAQLYADVRYLDLALTNYATALTFYPAATSPRLYALIQNNIGLAHYRYSELMGSANRTQLRAAETAFYDALRVGTPPDAARAGTLRSVGVVAYSLDDRAAACSAWREALTIYATLPAESSTPIKATLIDDLNAAVDREAPADQIAAIEGAISSSCAGDGVFVPTATPIPRAEAQIGSQTGTLEIGGGDVWTYAANAGDGLTIRVSADHPANDAPDRTGLLDTVVRVFAPDGSLLSEADDIAPDSLTDSEIRDLRLPTDGVYRIEVGAWGVGSGGYTLTLETD